MDSTQTDIIIYGTNWCYDSRRARSFFDRHQIGYVFVDIDKNPEAEARVKDINRGFRSVPTIIFTDGSILVEPSDSQIAQKLGIQV